MTVFGLRASRLLLVLAFIAYVFVVGCSATAPAAQPPVLTTSAVAAPTGAVPLPLPAATPCTAASPLPACHLVASAPVHTKAEAYGILHNFGVAGSPAVIAADLVAVCTRLDGTAATARQVWTDLSRAGSFGDNGGAVLAEAVDAYCPQYSPSVTTMVQGR